jgi:FkbM family methyltransferase
MVLNLKTQLRVIESRLPRFLLIFLVNLELWVRKSSDRISYSHETRQFKIQNKEYSFYFARKTRIILYSKGLDSRLESLAKNYFLNKISLTESDIFVDCGANVGEVSIFISRNYDCKIICVEPESLEFECLKLNLSACRTMFYNGVLSANTGITNFYSAPNSADSSIISPRVGLVPSPRHSWTLDSIFKDISFNGTVGLKLEAEGAEPEVLSGSKEILNQISFVTYDASPERGIDQVSTEKEVSETLLGRGFAVKESNPGRFVLFVKPLPRPSPPLT